MVSTRDSSAATLRFGLIGCGAISSRHVEALGHLAGAELVAVADRDAARANAIAGQTGCQPYEDYRSVVDRADVDAVIIATPSGLHARMALDAMDSGKHVLVEKPMSLSVTDADLMIDMSARRHLALGVVYHNRFNQASQILKRAVESGRLGRLVWGSASVKWYRPQQYYSDSGWRGTVAMDGGVLMNQAIHHIDLLLWMMGDVGELHAFRGTLGHDMEAEDTAIASLRFRSGALGSIDGTTCAYPKNLEETVTVIGTDGSVVMGGSKLDAFRSWEVPQSPLTEALEDRPKWYGHYMVLKDFADCVLNGRPPAVDGTEGRRSLALVLALCEQSRCDKPHEGVGTA
jgi:predicted dehydrogenase